MNIKKTFSFFTVFVCIIFIVGISIRNYDIKKGVLLNHIVKISETYENFRNKNESGFEVIIENKKGTLVYTPRQVLPYMMLAASRTIEDRICDMEDGKRMELLKAIAVVCRTNLVKYWEKSGRIERVKYPSDKLPIYGLFSNEKKDELLQARDETVGLILVYENNIIEAPYFYLSAGNTRKSDYPYIVKKSCNEDIYNKEGVNRITFTKESFWKNIENIVTKQEGNRYDILEQNSDNIALVRDDSGYVEYMEIVKKQDNNTIKIPANTIMETFELPSACFNLESGSDDKKISFFCTGIGDGYGLSLNYACYLALEGRDYQEILSYFYSGTSIIRRW